MDIVEKQVGSTHIPFCVRIGKDGQEGEERVVIRFSLSLFRFNVSSLLRVENGRRLNRLVRWSVEVQEGSGRVEEFVEVRKSGF